MSRLHIRPCGCRRSKRESDDYDCFGMCDPGHDDWSTCKYHEEHGVSWKDNSIDWDINQTRAALQLTQAFGHEIVHAQIMNLITTLDMTDAPELRNALMSWYPQLRDLRNRLSDLAKKVDPKLRQDLNKIMNDLQAETRAMNQEMNWSYDKRK